MYLLRSLLPALTSLADSTVARSIIRKKVNVLPLILYFQIKFAVIGICDCKVFKQRFTSRVDISELKQI